MKILVACEESGKVRRALRAKGHDAWSCDTWPRQWQTNGSSSLRWQRDGLPDFHSDEPMKQCANCRRPIPIEEPLVNGQCRICAKLPMKFKRLTMPTADSTPKCWITCARCRAPKALSKHQHYCPPCARAKAREHSRISRLSQEK